MKTGCLTPDHVQSFQWRLSTDTRQVICSGDLTHETLNNAMANLTPWPFTSSADQPPQIDLSGITTIDSTGVAFLIYLYHQSTLRACPVKFTGGSLDLRQLLEASRIDAQLPITFIEL